MKAARFFALICGAALMLTGCDLFLNTPEKDALSGAEYEVWLAKAPHLSVRMELVSGSGTTNPPAGLISLADNRPKLEVPFNASFSVNPGFGFVEWRAYRASTPVKDGDSKLGPQVEFKSLNASGTEVEVKILINEEITITPFCAALPAVTDHNLPNGTFDRLPTNYPVEIRFNTPVDPASLVLGKLDNPNATVTVTGVRSQGSGATVDFGAAFNLVIDEGGRWIRLEPKDANIVLANCNITVTLDPRIKSRDYPLYMAEGWSISYGASGSPDTSRPVVENIRGAGIGGVFTGGIDLQIGLDPEGRGVVYLLFNAYKDKGSIRELWVTEERIRGITGESLLNQVKDTPVYPVADDLLDSESELARWYIQEFQTMPYVVEHHVQTTEQGVIRFYIQPVDSYGNGYTREQARDRGYYIDALLDLPPGPVSGIRGVYNRNARTITLNWNDPANADLEHVVISGTGPVGSSAPVTVKAGVQSAVISEVIQGGYTFTFSTKDRGGNVGIPAVFPFVADSTIPSPVSALQGSYNPGSPSILLSWHNPEEDTEAEEIVINWSGTSNGSDKVALDGADQEYAITDIVAADGAAYTVTVKTANDLKESVVVSVNVYPDSTPPSPVTVTASYNQGSRTIETSWTDPADADLQEILLEWGINGESLVERQRINRGQQSYVITRVVSDSRGYTVQAYAVDRAGNKSNGTSQTVKTDTTPPKAVWSLAGSYNKEAQRITVTWNDPMDSDLKEIRLAWKVENGDLTPLTLDPGVGVYAIDKVGYNSGEYSITVAAADLAGNVGKSDTVNVRTDSRPESLPAPTGVQVLPTGSADSKTLTIEWNAVSGATGYEVVYSTYNDSSTASPGGGTITDAADGKKTTMITGLSRASYYVWVRAKNALGAGEYNIAPAIGTPKYNVASLSNLVMSPVSISGFSPGTYTGYSITIPSTSSSFTATGYPNFFGTVQYKFSGAFDSLNTWNISPGAAGTVTVRVTAEDGSAYQDYTVAVSAAWSNPGGIVLPGEKITLSPTGPVNLNWTAAATQEFTVSSVSGATLTGIEWYVDGKKKTGAADKFTVTAKEYSLERPHTLTVRAKVDGLPYSLDAQFTVIR